MGNLSTTADVPDFIGLMKEMVDHKIIMPQLDYWVISEFGYIRKVSLDTMCSWLAGLSIPDWFTDFPGWWLAKSVEHRLLTTKVYSTKRRTFDEMYGINITRPMYLTNIGW